MTDLSINVPEPLPDPINVSDENLFPFINTVVSYTADISPCKQRNIAFAVLYISTPNEELRNKYIAVADAHNAALSQNSTPDSGVDLYVPTDVSFNTHYDTTFIDMQVNTRMTYYVGPGPSPRNTGFCMYPRSSMSKTPLMLANHTGIIDSGYRGNLIGAFRWLPVNDDPSYTVAKDTRLVQICHPTLCPVFVKVVSDVTEFELPTIRGTGGFGSTGI